MQKVVSLITKLTFVRISVDFEFNLRHSANKERIFLVSQSLDEAWGARRYPKTGLGQKQLKTFDDIE
jgi:hypothetical protein